MSAAVETLARPGVLPAKVYKIVPGEHAFYITIADVVEDGRRRPYEIFIATKDAAMPAAVVDPYQDKLAADQSVQQVCSPATMLASRFGDALKYGADKWSIEVLPPTPEDREQGRDIYRCVATLTGVEGITGSVFRPH